MKPSDVQEALEIEDLKSLVRDLRRDVKSLKESAALQTSRSQSHLSELQSKVESFEANARKVKNISDIPGRKTPKWYIVDVDFTYGDTAPQFNSTQITAEGPFVCTQMIPYYLVLDDDYTHYQGPVGSANPDANATPLAKGRYFPCTAEAVVGKNLLNLGQFAATGAPAAGKGPLRDIPEFSFRIEVGGSGVFWTQDKTVPAAAFYGAREPLYLGIQGYAERTDRLIVHAHPEADIPLTGRVRMVFHGFQIAGDINISRLLGY
jgi:hypothetical protein